MRRLPLFVAMVLPVFAQDTIPDSNNLVHHRHEHPRNEKHATVAPTEDRFFTSRDGAELELTNEDPMFTFAVFGDRTGGPADGVNILADAVRDVNLFEPDMVMTVGDLINGYNERPEWLKEMKEYKGIMDNLICPWYPVAGNHDIYWRGSDRPPQEHEDAYEKHFGPLWYAFEHKDSFFIVLYSDEPNPETGERNFSKPESQKMSPEQFSWLKETLAKAKDAQHVFLFLHHPRWIGGNYGNDWDKVHEELVRAGNVSAVFAGHVHYMRYDPRDGINYVTLATTGGHQSGAVPAAGYLHHYHYVTVRENQLGITAYPVGSALDVRDITPELLAELRGLAGAPVKISPTLELSGSGALDQELEVTVSNPASRPIDLDLFFDISDPRWRFSPDHDHVHLGAGEEKSIKFRVSRSEAKVDESFGVPTLQVAGEFLSDTSRYPLPVREVTLPFSFSEMPESADLALDFNGKDQYLSVASDRIPVENELTLEAWFNARAFGPRTGLVTKAEGSDYGIFVNDGRPNFIVHIDGSYLEMEAPQPMLTTGEWHHIAGVYDGSEGRLYVDGKLVVSKQRTGKRRTNNHPLIIAGDTGRRGANSLFTGRIDSVRLSNVARYSGEEVEITKSFDSDEETLFLYDMDLFFDKLVYDKSSNSNHATVHGSPNRTQR
ncbi:MAG: LamG-like jellyroll fold domain-containing protein [Verrucomicrobiota bacterium JB023]|nr:LamG-like jellyroll fold domain-containing protein [Verrucomicrobiota bacterium JB023]